MATDYDLLKCVAGFTFLDMQNLRWAVVPLLLTCCASFSIWGAAAKPPKTHTVSLGLVKRVPFVAADVAAEDKADSATTLKVRPILVDGYVKDWATGDTHDVTERTFVVRRVVHLNDALPGDRPRWIWQPGPWLMVDRSSGHIATLHLPDFDDTVSDVVWFRDYAAYCGVHTTTRTSNLMGNVWQIGTSRRMALSKSLARWPQPERLRPVCMPAKWQRDPMRVTLQINGGQPTTFDIVGTSSSQLDEPDDSN